MNANIRSGLVLVLLGLLAEFIGGDIGRGVGVIFMVVGVIFVIIGLIWWRPASKNDAAGG